MLHGSRPILHPSLPLLVCSLDGRELLFANVQENTYLKHEVPFEASTSKTSASTCVRMRFTPCGNYIWLARFTTRHESTLFGPTKLSMMAVTIALSSKDSCSGKPHTLPGHRWVDLGVWPTLVPHLPYNITWTDSDAYLCLGGDILRVYRFPFPTSNSTTRTACGSGIYTLSRDVPLPFSAQSRSIYFFPAKGKTSAKKILGSLRGEAPEPPVVVYLTPNSVGDWVEMQDKVDSTRRRPIIRDDPFIEDPSLEDDHGLLIKTPRLEVYISSFLQKCSGSARN
jgi:hypothetical protein